MRLGGMELGGVAGAANSSSGGGGGGNCSGGCEGWAEQGGTGWVGRPDLSVGGIVCGRDGIGPTPFRYRLDARAEECLEVGETTFVMIGQHLQADELIAILTASEEFDADDVCVPCDEPDDTPDHIGTPVSNRASGDRRSIGGGGGDAGGVGVGGSGGGGDGGWSHGGGVYRTDPLVVDSKAAGGSRHGTHDKARDGEKKTYPNLPPLPPPAPGLPHLTSTPAAEKFATYIRKDTRQHLPSPLPPPSLE